MIDWKSIVMLRVVSDITDNAMKTGLIKRLALRLHRPCYLSIEALSANHMILGRIMSSVSGSFVF